jgi:alkylation response protein AidB-like acyl-CoA dehydrogenase
VVTRAKANGSIDDPIVRDRLAQLKVELSAIRSFALRALALVEGGQDSAAGGGAGSIFKLAWANWHRQLGEVAMDVAGASGLLTQDAAGSSGATYDLDEHQRLFLFSRSDTIYGGSDEIQKNILAERVLGLPREPRFETAAARPPQRPSGA